MTDAQRQRFADLRRQSIEVLRLSYAVVRTWQVREMCQWPCHR